MKGELVYLSSKNISFMKGLTRKLIGPYWILDDFNELKIIHSVSEQQTIY